MKHIILYAIFYIVTFSAHSQSLGLINVKTLQKDNSIALTLDACEGPTDWRILYLLKKENIKTTIFVTKKWIDKNKEAILFLNENKNLFQIQNHGRDHREAVFSEVGAYHLPGVINEEGLKREVEEGNEAIKIAFGVNANWYRDAGALYDKKSLEWLKEHHWNIGGYSIAGDEGARASKERILQILKTVKSKDVILMHVNHPTAKTYEGLVVSIPLLKEKGFQFEWLEK